MLDKQRDTLWFEDCCSYVEAAQPPEYQFLAAIVARALDDILDMQVLPVPTSDQIKWAMNASIWLGIVPPSPGYNPAITFEDCCDYLHLDADNVRSRVLNRETRRCKSYRRE